jgi:hypothetical protein
MDQPPDPPRLCGRARGDKGPCKLQAGRRTSHPGWGHCWLHGGNSPNGIKYAARLKVEWTMQTAVFYGLPVPDVTPEQLLLDEVRRSAAIVAWLELMISQWRMVPESPEEELARVTAEDPDGPPSDGPELLEHMRIGKSTGLPALGTVVYWEKGGTVAPTEVAAWLDRYERERTMAVRAAKAAIDAGVAERLVRLAETQVATFLAVIRDYHAKAGLEMTPERVALLSQSLRALGGASGPVVDVEPVGDDA